MPVDDASAPLVVDAAEVGGVQVFRCPFCDEEPQSSDIKFRKHLKSQHPTQKTLLKYSKKSSQAENFNARELRNAEKLYKLVETGGEDQADIYSNSAEDEMRQDVKVGAQPRLDHSAYFYSPGYYRQPDTSLGPGLGGGRSHLLASAEAGQVSPRQTSL